MQIHLYNPITHLFDFFVEAIIKDLEKKNFSVVVINKIEIDFNKIDSNDIVLIIINPHFIFDYEDIKNNIMQISKKIKFKILYLTEPINFIVEKNVYLELIKMIKPYCLWTYTYENFGKINSKINIFKIFPTGNFQYIDIGIKKNIDKIIFFGNITINRIDICNQFNEYLINKNNSWTKEEWKDILNNHLFYLNIHRRVNCKSFESFRIIPILANGGVVFSERCNEREEEQFKDFNIIFVERDHLYNTFLNYIENINYNTIFEKTKKFRETIIKDDLDEYISFHKNIHV